MKKLFLFSMMCLMALAMVAFVACIKENGNSDSGDSDSGTSVVEAPGSYVDLGLPSGTKWKDVNENNPADTTGNGFYTYEEAEAAFGNKLPTKEQFMELKEACFGTWTGSGYKFTGSNGNSIELPASGFRICDGSVPDVGPYGRYWTSTIYDSVFTWYFLFSSDGMGIGNFERCFGQSVRLVQD